MATGNTAARNSRAEAFSTDYATATLTIKSGATTLATHTLAGFGAASTGVITASAIADVTIAVTATANSAVISSASGEYTLTVGLSNADVIVNSTSYVSGGASKINSLAVTFPA